MSHPPVETAAAPPLLIVVSGPSGVGKDATLKRMQARSTAFHFVVTTTTRARRPTEVEGVDYHFVSLQEFQEKLARGEFLEYANVYGNWYGNSQSDIEMALARGMDVLMRIDVQGAATIRKKVDDAVFIFLLSTLDELETRLRSRQTESEDALRIRLATAAQEMKEQTFFDYCLPNHDSQLDRTVDDIITIIRAEKLRTHPRHVRFKLNA